MTHCIISPRRPVFGVLLALLALTVVACSIRAVWTRTWDGAAHFDDSAAGIAIDREGNVVVVGQTTDYTPEGTEPGQIVFLEYAQDGSLRWATQYGHAPGSNDFVFGTAIDERGTVYAVGSGPGEDGGILAVDTNGALLFRDALPGVAFDVVVGAPGVCVTGAEATSCYSRDGALVWQAAHSGATGRSIVIDREGNVLVAGSVAERTASPEDAWWMRDVWIAKYSRTGALLWERREGAEGQEDGLHAIAVDASGNLFATGRVSSRTGVGDFFLVKAAPDGTELWRVQDDLSSAYLERGDDVAVDASGHAIVVSMSYSTSSSGVRTTTRYAPDGRVVWRARTTGISDLNPDVHFHRVSLDASGRIYVTGTAITVAYDGSGRELARAEGPTVSESFVAIDGSRVFVAESERRGYLDVRLSRYEPR